MINKIINLNTLSEDIIKNSMCEVSEEEINYVFNLPFTFNEKNVEIYVYQLNNFTVHDNGLIINDSDDFQCIKDNWYFHELIEKYGFIYNELNVISKNVKYQQLYNAIIQLTQIIIECNQLVN